MPAGKFVTRDPGPGQVMFQFIRFWSRRWSDPSEEGLRVRGKHVLITEAVQTLSERGEVTVNAVSVEVGIDQSGVSRIVKEAQALGYLDVRPSPSDARRRIISVTSVGLGLLESAHAWQEHMFGLLTEGWTQEEREQFRTSMAKIIDRSNSLQERK